MLVEGSTWLRIRRMRVGGGGAPAAEGGVNSSSKKQSPQKQSGAELAGSVASTISSVTMAVFGADGDWKWSLVVEKAAITAGTHDCEQRALLRGVGRRVARWPAPYS